LPPVPRDRRVGDGVGLRVGAGVPLVELVSRHEPVLGGIDDHPLLLGCLLGTLGSGLAGVAGDGDRGVAERAGAGYGDERVHRGLP
jgi:hypothetical protein